MSQEDPMSSASSRIVSLEQAKRWKGNNQKNEEEKKFFKKRTNLLHGWNCG